MERSYSPLDRLPFWLQCVIAPPCIGLFVFAAVFCWCWLLVFGEALEEV